MCWNHCQELEIAIAAVDEAMTAAHRAIMHLARQQLFLSGIGKHSGLTFEKVHYLAVGVMAMIAYRRPWLKRAEHDFVVIINKPARHILTLTAFEIGSNIEFQIFKINYHSSNKLCIMNCALIKNAAQLCIMHYELCINQSAAQLCIVHYELCII